MSTSLKFVHSINVPASQVYRAFTNSTAFREWLCDTASIDPKPGGRFYVAWNSGYYAGGEYVKLQQDKEVVFIWAGRDDPEPTRVTVTITALDNGATTLSLEQVGLDNSPTWSKAKDEISRGWNEGLANLISVLENGPDLRIVNRPMMGVMFTDFNKKRAEELGIPVSEGLRLESTVEGLGAHQAGLQKNDVIVSMDGKPATDFNTLVHLLQGYKAGDTVELGIYRGAEKKRIPMPLSSRPLPQIPKTAAEFGDMLQKLYAETDKELSDALRDASDEEAGHKPGPEDWSAKETLAHLLHGERDNHAWLNDMVFSQERVSDGFGDNLPARITATVEVYRTKDAILEELFRNEQETVHTVANLSANFVANKASFWRGAFILLQAPIHIREHIEQIKQAIASARK
ncbi:MAG TPA: SRPBCC domain-containing protein [Anaerolinea sp.]|nr:SRPBCC domain-containing protein [Anaerolinea sp.]